MHIMLGTSDLLKILASDIAPQHSKAFRKEKYPVLNKDAIQIVPVMVNLSLAGHPFLIAYMLEKSAVRHCANSKR